MLKENELKRKKEQSFHIVGLTGSLFFISLITGIVFIIIHAVKSESFFVFNSSAIAILINGFIFIASLVLFIIANISHDRKVKEWQETGDKICRNCGANFAKDRFDTETTCEYCGSQL
jgi:uncharacterized protein YqhQ